MADRYAVAQHSVPQGLAVDALGPCRCRDIAIMPGHQLRQDAALDGI
jgi:hypothetical protein